MKATAGGNPYLDFSALTEAQTAVLSEVTVDTYSAGTGDDAREVTRVKFKLHDKRAALVDLGRHLGMFINKHHHAGTINVVEGDSAIERIRARVARAVVAEAAGGGDGPLDGEGGGGD